MQPTRDHAARRIQRWRWCRRLISVLLLLLVGDYFLYPHLGDSRGPIADRGENGLWLRYHWYFGRRTDAEVEALARRLARNQIRYAYFHVRHVTAEGSLRYHYREQARRLVARVHRAAPSVRVIAWVFAGNNGAGGLPVVDLSNEAVRREMVREARWLVDECGFDGVQWDYEVCRSGDASLPSLLRETRAALQTRPAGSALERRGAPIISVATAVWGPPALRRWTWSEAYLGDVAAAADQVAVMCYDTGLYLPRAYVWLVREQAVRATRAAARRNPRCRVLLGVPTYARGGPSHHAPSENLRMALRGVREGMSDPRADSAAFAGVALFADYTTQADEWQTYSRQWLAR